MKIIVTGGAGFIGSNLVEELVRLNHKVIIIDNLSTGRLENIQHLKTKITFFKGDISKKGKWSSFFRKTDWVFHLAAIGDIVPSITNPTKYFKSNVEGTLNVLEAARKYKIKKLLYAASSSCYGIPKKYPTKENEQIDPKYPYALTKNLGEQLVMHWSKVYKLKIISLRFFNVYGVRSRTSGTYGAMFGVFLAQKLSKKNLTIVGDGKQTRDFIYVKDVVRAMLLAMKSRVNNEIFNVGAGSPVSVNEIVKNLNVKKKNIYIPKRPGEPNITHANINKIKKILKWKPQIGIKEGIKLLLQNINYWKKAPVWTPKKIKNTTKEWFKYLG